MSDKPLRRVLFSSPRIPGRFQTMKTIMKPKEEVRSVNPVATPTLGTKKRKRLSPFPTTPLRDIYDSSPTPLPIAAAAAAAAAAKRASGTDEPATVAKIVKAAGNILHKRFTDECEERKEESVPRKTVTFAEPIQVSGNENSLLDEDAIEPLCRKGQEENGEDSSKPMERISAMDSDANDEAMVLNENHNRSFSSGMHQCSSAEHTPRSGSRMAQLQHIPSVLSSVKGRQIDMERELVVNSKKKSLERDEMENNEYISLHPHVRSISDGEEARMASFTGEKERHGNTAFDSDAIEKEPSSQIPDSNSTPRTKRRRTESKLGVKANTSDTEPCSKELSQPVLKEENFKSPGPTESPTSESNSSRRSFRRSNRKSRLSEVLKLQKSLETAYWTDSRMVQRQNQAIIISDGEMEKNPDQSRSIMPGKTVAASISKERDKSRSKTEPVLNTPDPMKKYDKRRRLAKSSKSLSVLNRGSPCSPCVALRTRSNTARNTKTTLQSKPGAVSRVLRHQSRSHEQSDGESSKIRGQGKHTKTVDVLNEVDQEMRAAKTPKSSKRKARPPKRLQAQFVSEGTEELDLTGNTCTENVSSGPKEAPLNVPWATKLSRNVDNIDSNTMKEDLSKGGEDNLLQDLVKVRLSKGSWESFKEGWAVHNGITSCGISGIKSTSVGQYVLSPFGCEGLISAFQSELGLGSTVIPKLLVDRNDEEIEEGNEQTRKRAHPKP